MFSAAVAEITDVFSTTLFADVVKNMILCIPQPLRKSLIYVIRNTFILDDCAVVLVYFVAVSLYPIP